MRLDRRYAQLLFQSLQQRFHDAVDVDRWVEQFGKQMLQIDDCCGILQRHTRHKGSRPGR